MTRTSVSRRRRRRHALPRPAGNSGRPRAGARACRARRACASASRRRAIRLWPRRGRPCRKLALAEGCAQEHLCRHRPCRHRPARRARGARSRGTTRSPAPGSRATAISPGSAPSAAARAASSSAGTGSIGITYDGQTIRVGGYGFPVSDEGSGADLGLNAVRYALRTLDGRAEPSEFSKEVLASSRQRSRRRDRLDGERPTPPTMPRSRRSSAAFRRRRAGGAPLLREAGRTSPGWSRRCSPAARRASRWSAGWSSSSSPYLPGATAARLTAPQADAMAGGILLAKQRRALEVNW